MAIQKESPNKAGIIRATRVGAYTTIAYIVTTLIQFLPILSTIPVEYQTAELVLLASILTGLDKYLRTKKTNKK